MPYRPPIHQPIARLPGHVAARREQEPFYKTAAWQLLRLACLKRDHFRCQIVLPGCETKAKIADHIIERREGGPDVLSNLRAACASCHNKRHPDRWQGTNA